MKRKLLNFIIYFIFAKANRMRWTIKRRRRRRWWVFFRSSLGWLFLSVFVCSSSPPITITWSNNSQKNTLHNNQLFYVFNVPVSFTILFAVIHFLSTILNFCCCCCFLLLTLLQRHESLWQFVASFLASLYTFDNKMQKNIQQQINYSPMVIAMRMCFCCFANFSWRQFQFFCHFARRPTRSRIRLLCDRRSLLKIAIFQRICLFSVWMAVVPSAVTKTEFFWIGKNRNQKKGNRTTERSGKEWGRMVLIHTNYKGKWI